MHLEKKQICIRSFFLKKAQHVHLVPRKNIGLHILLYTWHISCFSVRLYIVCILASCMLKKTFVISLLPTCQDIEAHVACKGPS